MKSLFLPLFLLIAVYSHSQVVSQGQQQVIPIESALQFDQDEFNGRFAVMVISDNEYDYFVTDLTRLPLRFERIYFLNLTYNDHRMVNIDPDLEKEQMWFKAHYQYKEHEIVCLFDDFLKETLETGKTWSDEEKQEWLTKYDKYNKR